MKGETPINITANKLTSELLITWDDGEQCVYSFELLRTACPCASCRGGHEYMSPEPDPGVWEVKIPDSPAVHLRSIEGVGSYGITVELEDGHHFGIYNWHYLRKLCKK